MLDKVKTVETVYSKETQELLDYLISREEEIKSRYEQILTDRATSINPITYQNIMDCYKTEMKSIEEAKARVIMNSAPMYILKLGDSEVG